MPWSAARERGGSPICEQWFESDVPIACAIAGYSTISSTTGMMRPVAASYSEKF